MYIIVRLEDFTCQSMELISVLLYNIATMVELLTSVV